MYTYEDTDTIRGRSFMDMNTYNKWPKISYAALTPCSVYPVLWPESKPSHLNIKYDYSPVERGVGFPFRTTYFPNTISAMLVYCRYKYDVGK